MELHDLIKKYPDDKELGEKVRFLANSLSDRRNGDGPQYIPMIQDGVSCWRIFDHWQGTIHGLPMGESLAYLRIKYETNWLGVIHIGAHKAEEMSGYAQNGIQNVIWVEPQESLYLQILTKIQQESFDKMNQQVLNALIGSEDGLEVEFNEYGGSTNNDGYLGSSSILKRSSKHIDYIKKWKKNRGQNHNERAITGKTIKQIYTWDFIVKSNKIDMKKYPLLVVDVEGYELYVLQGMKDSLKFVDCAILECSVLSQLHEGGSNLKDLDLFMIKNGFERVELHVQCGNAEGDAVYLRK